MTTNRVKQEKWGNVDGKDIFLCTLINANGIEVQITNYGCTIVSWSVPDRKGKLENIVLGLSTLEDYVAGHPCLGNVIGRYANRIGGAKFSLNGIEYKLPANCGKNHIHGGYKHFGVKVWDIAGTKTSKGSVTLSLTYTSPDMEEGFPGNLSVRLDYTLSNEGQLKLDYTAITDKPTVLNLTNHVYFNLAACKEDIRNHQVRIYAETYTPVNIPTDEENIPTGEIEYVEGTAYDLRQWTTINDRMTVLPRGFDNNYCISTKQKQLVLAAELFDPRSGRLLQTYTTEPAVVFYTSCNLDGKKKGPEGIAYNAFMGACFETQHYPDSPNKPNFPSTVLNPGEVYRQLTIYEVGVKP